MDRSISGRDIFFYSNIFGAITILDLCCKHESCLHIVSTDEVYGDIPSGKFVTEESPYNPTTPYASSKSAAAQIAISYHKTYGLPVTLSNGSNNYGINQHVEKFIPKVIMGCFGATYYFMWSWSQKERLDICKRSFRGHYGYNFSWLTGESYNLGSGNEMSNLDVAMKIIRIASRKGLCYPDEVISRLFYGEVRNVDDNRYGMDCSKIKNLGWFPKMVFENVIRDMLASVRWQK